MDLYLRKVLRVSVAEICQTIGYNSIQTIPLELLIDSLHKFLQEFARDLHRHVELFNRTEANLDDVAISLQSLNINVNDLLEYINHVQPVAFAYEIPKLPAPKSSNLNFLKPGSKEVLTRPVHIYEHLPPILRDNGDTDEKNIPAPSSPNSNTLYTSHAMDNSIEVGEVIIDKLTGTKNTDKNDTSNKGTVTNETNNSICSLSDLTRKTAVDSNVGPPSFAAPSSATREISSVMMTSGGFISPAIEGRMPDCLIPDVVEKYFGLDSPPSTTSTANLNSQISVSATTTGVVSSSNIKLPHSIESSRSFVKTDETNGSSATFIEPLVDKKLFKKGKRKSISITAPPSTQGSVVATDKAQRKRLKKNMGKSSGSQEKFMKKQFKLKQKQIRQQYVQKQVEAALSATSASISSSKAPGHGILQGEEADNSNIIKSGNILKTKKDYFTIQSTLGEELNVTVPEILRSPSTSLPFPPPKGVYKTFSSSQDIKLKSLPSQSNIHGIPPKHYDEIKLSTEPDRTKLNIFKKISSSGRKERPDTSTSLAQATTGGSTADEKPMTPSSNTTIFGDSQVISLPSGTTITPAPPSGSGRHVYAPPPSSTQAGDFDTVISVDDDGGIPEGSAVLMQRGDLMIQKPKKRGRKPGSKNQPKILGFPTKKTKKSKKSFFGHSSSNLMEPLNLSNNSIVNIDNIPLGIASTFPIDSETSMKMKKERKKSKMGKDSSYIRNTGKPNRNLAPTKEEFASINQKLMMMDTVLQAAPPLSSSSHSPMGKTSRLNSPSFGIAIPEPDQVGKTKREKKKGKHLKETKQMMQQGPHTFPNPVQIPMNTGRRSPPSYPTPNFPNVPGIGNIQMFPFYPFPARPGLIPSHNLFSQMPNVHNNPLFMPSLMGFPPLNPSIRSILKEEKDQNIVPLLQAGEGNYSKIAPLVPETMKLDLPITSASNLSNPGISSLKPKASSSKHNVQTSPSVQSFNQDTNITSTIVSGNLLPSDSCKKPDKTNLSTMTSSSSSNLNPLKSLDMTIEVSSDDSIEAAMVTQAPKMTHHFPSSISLSSSLLRQPHQKSETIPNIETDRVEDSETSTIERKNKEHKKLKKNVKQDKKHLPLSGIFDSKHSIKFESIPSVSDSFVDVDTSITESVKKIDELANSSGQNTFDYDMSPERRKDHKKMKKLLKEGKIKKKKDKKDKNKNKDRSAEKIEKSDKSDKRKEEKKDKDKIKKMKKEKKKEKQRGDIDTTAVKYASSSEGNNHSAETSSVVPKLTLKLGQTCKSPSPTNIADTRKVGGKSSLAVSVTEGDKPISFPKRTSSDRDPSPELARISPLVTRPPKQKSGIDDVVSSSTLGNLTSSSVNSLTGVSHALFPSHQTPSLSASLNILVDSVINIDSNSGEPSTSTLPASATILGLGMNTSCNNSPGGNLMMGMSTSSTSAVSSSVNLAGSSHSQHQQSTTKHSSAVPLISDTNRPSSYIDAEGNRVWICPACGKVDDGSAMIGCDGCDAWYHWVCVGIFVAPNDNEDWYCRVCIAKKRGLHGSDKKRKRNKKKNINC